MERSKVSLKREASSTTKSSSSKIKSQKSQKFQEKGKKSQKNKSQSSRRNESSSSKSSGTSEGDDDEENDGENVDDLNRKVEKLERDVIRRDRELADEKLETEHALDRIKKLEREKAELRRDAEESKDEADEYRRALEDYQNRQKMSKSSSVAGKSAFLKTGSDEEANGNDGSDDDSAAASLKQNRDLLIQQKNREIEKLLEDIEVLEEEKQGLHESLQDLRENLSESTKCIESMTRENLELKLRTEKAQEFCKILNEEKNILEIKEKDLIAYKERHEEYLDNLSSAVDVRVDIWKKMMIEKDEEIERLGTKVNTPLEKLPNNQLDTEKSSIDQLKMKLVERDENINLLNEKLTQATEDLVKCTKTIENLNSRLEYSQDPQKTEKLIQTAQSRIKKLEKELEKKNRAFEAFESESEERSRELTSLYARMSQYEAGTYGLVDAVGEIKELKCQLKVRNEQIERLTRDINLAQMSLNELYDENGMLRDKFGFDPSTDFRDETRSFVKNRKNEIIHLTSKIYQCEEEIIQLKTKNYSLKKQLKLSMQNAESSSSTYLRRSDGSPALDQDLNQNQIQTQDSNTTNLWKEKYQIILDENSELRRGLQEILDSIHRISEEGTTEVILESPILENLLREMSARGLINYPHPIGGFHSKLCNLEGKNSQLREEINRLRSEEKTLRSELIDSKAKVQTLESKVAQNNLQVQDYLTSTLMLTCPDPKIHIETLSSTSFTDLYPSLDKLDQESQTDFNTPDNDDEDDDAKSQGEVLQDKDQNQNNKDQNRNDTSLLLQKVENLSSEKSKLEEKLENLRARISELEISLDAKDKVMEGLRGLQSPCRPSPSPRTMQKDKNQQDNIFELKETLQVAQETITSLQQRLASKDDSILQYRKLVNEIRTEMTSSCERHVNEMRALQSTIHQQQQAFTRMKSTLCQPVKDSSNVESTIKDQLTRIHELEDEVSELQHALGNVASQLTSARSDAHKWRVSSDTRLKEIDTLREKLSEENFEELYLLREKVKLQQDLIDQWHSEKNCQEPVETLTELRLQLEEKEKELDIYAKALKMTGMKDDRGSKYEQLLNSKEKEIEDLQKVNKSLSLKISSMQLRLSKINAVNHKTGLTGEMEELKLRYQNCCEDKTKLMRQLEDIESKKVEEDLKRRKAAESMVKWEETKKWKKITEKLEKVGKELEIENQKLEGQIKNFRATIIRLEKEKIMLESRNKRCLSKASNSDLDVVGSGTERSKYDEKNQKIQIEELKEMVEKTEFEGHEDAERFKMEIKCLKDRIVSQERQLTALQIAQKGDPRIVQEIEKMAYQEDLLQKQILHLEEENLNLKLQIEQLRLDTPRLRDRVQHLQKLVDYLKSEKGPSGQIPSSSSSTQLFSKSTSKSLGELERTITMLKQVIEKLQYENKQLKFKPSSNLKSTPTDRIKCTIEALMIEKKELIERVKYVEDDKEKFQRLFLDASLKIKEIDARLGESEKKAKGLEVKLKTLFGDSGSQKVLHFDEEKASSGELALYQKIRDLQAELDRKSKLLSDAKITLKQVASSKTPTTNTEK